MTERLRSPILWFGGKGRMIAKLLPIVQAWPHTRYIEPFGGGASVLIAKEPVEVEVYNDVDEGLVNFFRVIADPQTFRDFYRRVKVLPYSRKLYEVARAEWQDEPDPVKRAVLWFVIARQSFGGRFDSGWGFIITASNRSMAQTISTWLSTIETLPAVAGRLLRVQIECLDWSKIIDYYDGADALFYCDPPYVQSTRRKKRYAHEMSDQDHEALTARLLTIEGAAVLSGYESPIYQPLLDAGWRKKVWHTYCHAAGRTRAAKLQGTGAMEGGQERAEVVYLHPLVAEAMNMPSEAEQLIQGRLFP